MAPHIESRDFFRRVGHEVLIQGNLDIDELTGAPVILTGKAEDAFLCHHLIQPGDPNLSSHVCHAVINRIKHHKVDELDLGLHGHAARMGRHCGLDRSLRLNRDAAANRSR